MNPSNSPLLELLTKALAFDKRAYRAFLERHKNQAKDGSLPKHIEAARWPHARLTPIHQAVVRLVKANESLLQRWKEIEPRRAPTSTSYVILDEALAELREACEKEMK